MAIDCQPIGTVHARKRELDDRFCLPGDGS